MDRLSELSKVKLIGTERKINIFDCTKDRKPFLLTVTNYRLIFECKASPGGPQDFQFPIHQITKIISKVEVQNEQQLFMLYIKSENMQKIIRVPNNSKLEQLKNDIKLSQLIKNHVAMAKMNEMINNPVVQ